MADVCAYCGKVLDGYSYVEIDGQIVKLCVEYWGCLVHFSSHGR